MNVKNFNPFERHVEKIALAAAAAGAAYMIYLSWPPMLSIEGNGTPVYANEVEGEVTKAVDKLQQAKDNTLKKGNIEVPVQNIVDEYRKHMMESPLQSQLVRADNIPSFIPRNIAVGGVGPIPGVVDQPVATPAAPVPSDLSAKPWLGQVQIVTQAPAADGQPGQPVVQIADVRLNLIHGTVDMGTMIAEMADPAIPAAQRLPTGLQRAVLYRIQVQRRQRTAAGWPNKWQDVAPDKLLPTPPTVVWSNVQDQDILANLNYLDQQVKFIAQPDYFPMANGGSVIQDILKDSKAPGAAPGPTGQGPGLVAPGGAPVPAGIMPRGAVAGPSGTFLAPGEGGGSRVPGSGGSRVPGSGGSRVPGSGDFRAPGGALPFQPAPPPEMAGMQPGPGIGQSTKIPFWFIDDSVTPGQEYQYQVQVVVYNPTYHWPHQLKTPAMKDQPTLASAWVSVPGSVEVRSDIYFYITGNPGAGPNPDQKIGAKIYRWNAGNWYAHDMTAEPGKAIASKMTLGDGKYQDVSTGYTMVDLREDNVVVLLDANGDLVTRDPKTDGSDNVKKEIDREMDDRAKAIAATQPAPVKAPPPNILPPQPIFPGGSRVPGGGSRVPGAGREPGTMAPTVRDAADGRPT